MKTLNYMLGIGIAVSILALASALLIGCSTIQGVENQPAEHRKAVVASAYSLSGCQENLDQQAGGHVEMSYHTQQIAMSVLNLGIVPPYYCQGVFTDPSTTIGQGK
jgi:predicted small secreted protein